jgi:hypothetical protein
MHLPNGYVGLGGWAEREGACVSGAPSASILLRATPRHTIRPPLSTARSLAPRRSLLTGFVRTRAHTHSMGGRRAGREGGGGRESGTHENHVPAGPRTRARCLGRQQTFLSLPPSLSLHTRHRKLGARALALGGRIVLTTGSSLPQPPPSSPSSPSACPCSVPTLRLHLRTTLHRPPPHRQGAGRRGLGPWRVSAAHASSCPALTRLPRVAQTPQEGALAPREGARACHLQGTAGAARAWKTRAHTHAHAGALALCTLGQGDFPLELRSSRARSPVSSCCSCRSRCAEGRTSAAAGRAGGGTVQWTTSHTVMGGAQSSWDSSSWKVCAHRQPR